MTTQATENKTAYVTGDTFRFKAQLKSNGWKWDADRRAWYMTDNWTSEGHVESRIRGYGGIRNRGNFIIELV